jgi:hypothetical protein
VIEAAQESLSLRYELANTIRLATGAAERSLRLAQEVFSTIVGHSKMPGSFGQTYNALCDTIVATETHLYSRGVSRQGRYKDGRVFAGHAAFPDHLRPRSVLNLVSHRTSMPGLAGRGATEIAHNLAVEVRSWVREALPQKALRANISVDIAPNDWRTLRAVFRLKTFPTDNVVDTIGAAIREQAIQVLHVLARELDGPLRESNILEPPSNRPEPLSPLHSDGDANADSNAIWFSGQWVDFGKAHAQQRLFAWCLKNNGKSKKDAINDLGIDENNFHVMLNALRKNLPRRLANVPEAVNITLDGKGTVNFVRRRRTS